MSFNLFTVEPTYDHISETYEWCFYNTIHLKQHFLLNGSMKYSLSYNFNNHETLIITEKKEPTEIEFKKLYRTLGKKIWRYLEKEANNANKNLNTFTDFATKLEKNGWKNNGYV